MFKLQFPERDLGRWAARYQVPREEDFLIEVEAPKIRARGFLTKRQFLRFCEWKTPRSRKACRGNPEALVVDATRAALGARREELKIGVLRILGGVEWPTASVILHLCGRERYPILDYRALESIGAAPAPPYNFAFWWEYTQFTRALARRSGCSMREVDRALWQYSKERS